MPSRTKPGEQDRIGRRAMSDAFLIWYDTVDGSIPKSALYNPDGSRFRGTVIGMLAEAQALDGYLARDVKPVWQILAECNDLNAFEEDAAPYPMTPESESRRVVHISGSGAYGRFDLICDAATHALMRARVVKRTGDIHGGGKVGRLSPGLIGIVDVEDVCEINVLRTSDDPDFPRVEEAALVEKRTMQNGDMIKMNGIVRRTGYEANPDFQARGAFVPKLNDNTPLRYLEGKGPAVAWRNGHVEAVTNIADLRSPTTQNAKPLVIVGASESTLIRRTWIVILLIALLTAFGLAIAVHRIRMRE